MPASIVPDLLDMFGETVTVRRALAIDGFGKVTSYGASFPIKCRIAQGPVVIRRQDGQEVTSRVQVTLAGVYGVKEADEMTLPSRLTPNKPPILRVRVTDDENGPHHEQLYC